MGFCSALPVQNVVWPFTSDKILKIRTLQWILIIHGTSGATENDWAVFLKARCYWIWLRLSFRLPTNIRGNWIFASFQLVPIYNSNCIQLFMAYDCLHVWLSLFDYLSFYKKWSGKVDVWPTSYHQTNSLGASTSLFNN